MMLGKLSHATVKVGVLRFKVLILIIHTVLWHMPNHLESTFISRLCIDSLKVLWI